MAVAEGTTLPWKRVVTLGGERASGELDLQRMGIAGSGSMIMQTPEFGQQ